MPSPRALVQLTSGEYALVLKVTPDGRDDRVVVVREENGVPKMKQVRITVDQISAILWEPHGD
jgi:hypothetical protein